MEIQDLITYGFVQAILEDLERNAHRDEVADGLQSEPDEDEEDDA